MDERRLAQVDKSFFEQITMEPDKAFTFEQIKRKFGE